MDWVGFFFKFVFLRIIVVILAILTAAEIGRTYKKTRYRSNLVLFIFVAWIAIAYFEQVVVLTLPRFGLLEPGGQVHRMLTATFFTAGSGIAGACAALFAINTIKPRKGKLLSAVVIAIALIHIIITAIRGEEYIMTSVDVGEWFPPAELAVSLVLVAIMAFSPGVILFAFGSVSKSAKQKISGFTLGIGFIVLAFFVFVFDQFSIQLPTLIFRGVFISIGVLLIYLGFTLPRWYLNGVLNLVRRKEAKGTKEEKW
jgi:hypothetical protein